MYQVSLGGGMALVSQESAAGWWRTAWRCSVTSLSPSSSQYRISKASLGLSWCWNRGGTAGTGCCEL